MPFMSGLQDVGARRIRKLRIRAARERRRVARLAAFQREPLRPVVPPGALVRLGALAPGVRGLAAMARTGPVAPLRGRRWRVDDTEDVAGGAEHEALVPRDPV